MAMIMCPECGTKISSKAAACVNCGLPIESICICPECSSTLLNDHLSECPKCGCPISSKKHKESDEEREAREIIEYIGMSERIIERVLSGVNLGWLGSDVTYLFAKGKRLPDNKKLNNVKMVLNIPDDVFGRKINVYAAVDATLFGGFSSGFKGFAICSDGLYYHTKSQRGTMYWFEFANVYIKKDFGDINIDSLCFSIGQSTYNIYNMLISLQEDFVKFLE